jgi:hypothetical protein
LQKASEIFVFRTALKRDLMHLADSNRLSRRRISSVSKEDFGANSIYPPAFGDYHTLRRSVEVRNGFDFRNGFEFRNNSARASNACSSSGAENCAHSADGLEQLESFRAQD